jgi:hypothetical protein
LVVPRRQLVDYINTQVRLSTRRHHRFIASSHHRIIASHHHRITASPHHRIIALSHHRITASSHHHIIASPHHRITASPHHRIITSILNTTRTNIKPYIHHTSTPSPRSAASIPSLTQASTATTTLSYSAGLEWCNYCNGIAMGLQWQRCSGCSGGE